MNLLKLMNFPFLKLNMAKQSAIQKNINRKTLIDRLSEKRKKLKKVLTCK